MVQLLWRTWNATPEAEKVLRGWILRVPRKSLIVIIRVRGTPTIKQARIQKSLNALDLPRGVNPRFARCRTLTI
jgi:hypothetical protein